MAEGAPTILALGGHLKNTVALFLGGAADVGWVKRSGAPPLLDEPAVAPADKTTDKRSDDPPSGIEKRGGASLRSTCPTHPAQVVMSAHVGDLDSRLGVEVFQRAADDLTEFFRLAPSAVVCDLHPDYASTRYAEQLAARWDAPLVRVQHHHAHVAACAAEHGLQGPVLGFSWDGAGYGPDGTVWGGEVLLCEGAEFQRAAHLRTFALPGGDRAAREPRRSALGLLFEILGDRAAEHAAAWFRPGEIDSLMSMLAQHVNTPRTSSMGRLFDAVAAICGLPPVISFEGQAAMALEFAAEENESGAYSLALSVCGAGVSPAPAVRPGGPHHNFVIDWEPLVHALLADRAAGVSVGRRSARFHNAPGRNGGDRRPRRRSRGTPHRAQRRLFSKRALGRAEPLATVGRRFSGVYSRSSPTG